MEYDAAYAEYCAAGEITQAACNKAITYFPQPMVPKNLSQLCKYSTSISTWNFEMCYCARRVEFEQEARVEDFFA